MQLELWGISICNRMRPSRIKINFHPYFQSFHKIAQGQIVKTLKIQVKFILNSTRTQCDNLFITRRAKFSMHVETQSAGPQNKGTCSPARKQSIHWTSSLTVAQRTEQERLTIMYILRDKCNSSSFTKHT